MTDYIKRENAKRAVWGCARDTGIDEAPFEYAEGLLEDVPSEDVAPVRHGRWKPLTDCSNEGIYCSECHKKVYRAEYSNTMKMHSLYCPNCGAKMDGGEE